MPIIKTYVMEELEERNSIKYTPVIHGIGETPLQNIE
jgi:hypothetical protein